MSSHAVIIFYKYTSIENPEGFKQWMRGICEELNLRGRILIAHEGINGTCEGVPEAIAEYERRVRQQDGSPGTYGDFSDVWFKESPGNGSAFPKLKIKVRSEIVSTHLSRDEDVDPRQMTGTPIEASELKRWFDESEEFEIIDMRNDYEYAVGHFRGAHQSGMTNFRDLKKIVSQHDSLKEKKVLTVCTYGVRCEKASGYLMKQGFKNVYQLHGGIGTYMKEFPGKDFLGSLYVFDDRMTEQFTDDYQKIGECVVCHQVCERFSHCANDVCHKQLIVCEGCQNALGSVWCAGDHCVHA